MGNFNIITVALLGVGVLLVYSGWKKKNPIDVIRDAVK